MLLFAGFRRASLTLFTNNVMSKSSHFDIGAWAKEKGRLKKDAIAKNETISGLKQDISKREETINELKRKVNL